MKLITFFRRRSYRVAICFKIGRVVSGQSGDKNINDAKSLLYEIIFKHIFNPIIAPPEHYFQDYTTAIRFSNGVKLVGQIHLNQYCSKNVSY